MSTNESGLTAIGEFCAPDASPAMQPAAAAGHARTASSASNDAADTTVRVALRARPLVARERLDGAKVINRQMLNCIVLLLGLGRYAASGLHMRNNINVMRIPGSNTASGLYISQLLYVAPMITPLCRHAWP
jgi:hypothetical protein